MRPILFIRLVLLFMLPQLLAGQTIPKEGSELNFRRVGFSFPIAGTVTKYKIEIASKAWDREDSFKKNIIKTVYSTSGRAIAEVPYFDKEYTWQVTYTYKNATMTKSPLHHFRTGYNSSIDTAKNLRLRILDTAKKYRDNYVFVDGNNVLYDMKGNPVWYLPYNEKNGQEFPMVRDLKISPQGTLTYLINQHAIEESYNGDTLWKGPNNGEVSGEDSERYHHEFTRLTNGHYMVLGVEHVLWDHKITPVDTGFAMTEDDKVKTDTSTSGTTKKTPFGTIIEYDEQGHVVWSWKSSTYMMGSDVVNYRPEGKAKVIDVHENAFYFDERDSVIYISFRNLSRILKIKYPEGTVINTYGEIFKPGKAPAGNGLFSYQHGIKKSKNGYLYLYNNNPTEDSLAKPTIVLLKESASGKDSLTKIWEYECNIAGIRFNELYRKAREKRQEKAQKKMAPQLWKGTMFRVTTGGSVTELPNKDLFVCMNSQYSKLFIVNRDKKILWSATPELYNRVNSEWYLNVHLYRACLVTPKELDKLIYNSMKTQENK